MSRFAGVPLLHRAPGTPRICGRKMDLCVRLLIDCSQGSVVSPLRVPAQAIHLKRTSGFGKRNTLSNFVLILVLDTLTESLGLQLLFWSSPKIIIP